MKVQEIKEPIDRLFNGIIAHIETIVLGKYPHADIMNLGWRLNKIFDSSGNRVIETDYRQELEITTTAPESSHPELKRSITRVMLTIIAKANGSLTITHRFPIDGVDVHYGKFDKKINNKNVSLGRAWNRKVVKYFTGTFMKHVPHTRELSPIEINAINTLISYEDQKDKLNTQIHFIINEVVPNDRDVKDMRRRGGHRHSLNLGYKYGFDYENHKFYEDGKLIAPRKDMRSYIRSNPKRFIPNFDELYPLLK
jgi:hypothetical protein